MHISEGGAFINQPRYQPVATWLTSPHNEPTERTLEKCVAEAFNFVEQELEATVIDSSASSDFRTL